MIFPHLMIVDKIVPSLGLKLYKLHFFTGVINRVFTQLFYSVSPHLKGLLKRKSDFWTSQSPSAHSTANQNHLSHVNFILQPQHVFYSFKLPGKMWILVWICMAEKSMMQLINLTNKQKEIYQDCSNITVNSNKSVSNLPFFV